MSCPRGAAVTRPLGAGPALTCSRADPAGGGRGAFTCPGPRIRGAEQPRWARRRHGGGRGQERRVPAPRR